MEGEMDDDQGVPQRRMADLSVIQYQVGAMQTALDRGIGALERSIDKGFEGVNGALEKLDARVKTIEERQAFDAARLKALEQFRDESDRRESERAKEMTIEAKQAMDNSQMWKIGRWLAGGILFLFTLAGIVAGIANAVGGP